MSNAIGATHDDQVAAGLGRQIEVGGRPGAAVDQGHAPDLDRLVHAGDRARRQHGAGQRHRSARPGRPSTTRRPRTMSTAHNHSGVGRPLLGQLLGEPAPALFHGEHAAREDLAQKLRDLDRPRRDRSSQHERRAQAPANDVDRRAEPRREDRRPARARSAHVGGRGPRSPRWSSRCAGTRRCTLPGAGADDQVGAVGNETGLDLQRPQDPGVVRHARPGSRRPPPKRPRPECRRPRLARRPEPTDSPNGVSEANGEGDATCRRSRRRGLRPWPSRRR